MLLQMIFVIGNMWFGILIHLIIPDMGNTLAGDIAQAGLSFIPTFLAVPFLTWLLHKRPSWSVAMPKLGLEGWNLGIGFLFAWLALLVSYGLYVVFGGVHMSFQMPDPKTYVPLFIFGLITLFIQTSSEELFFRGYIMQFARRLTASPVLIILASAILFARPHLTNLSGLGFPTYAIVLYVLDGAFFAWLAYRSRSLWMSTGFHLGNNLGLMVLVAEANSGDAIQGAPVLTTDGYPPVNLMIIVAFVVYILAALIIHRLLTHREQKTVSEENRKIQGEL